MKFLRFIAGLFLLLTTSFVLAAPIPGHDVEGALLVRDVDELTQIMVKRVYDDPSGTLFRRISADDAQAYRRSESVPLECRKYIRSSVAVVPPHCRKYVRP
jgi:hypothetical protein